jgi:hypothetical protein
MRQVVHDNKTYALILSQEDFCSAAKFVSEPEWPLQVGLLRFPAAHMIAAHAHLRHDGCGPCLTQEFLLVISGSMEADFFNEVGKRFHTETINQGEALFHIQGGHAFRFGEEAKLFEVKSGPYLGRDKDKVYLDSVSA